MFSMILSAAVIGVEAKAVQVEADVCDGLPMFCMVGDLSTEVREAADRVRTALRNTGIAVPPKRVTVNLSPAHIRKEGTRYDLPVAAALLAACKIVRHLPKQYQMISQGVGNGVSSEGEPARLRVVLLRRNSVARQMRPEVLTPKRAELELLTPDSAEPKFIPLKSVEKEEQRSEPGSDQNVPGKAVKSGQPDHETGQVKTVSEEFAVYSEGAVCTDADRYRRMDVSAWTSADEICKLECNLDDCSGEVLGYTMERLMREGARDVSYMPIYMKKNRPAYLLTVLCHPDDRERMEQIIYAETTAIGIRHAIMQRSILHRETDQKKSSFGKVAVKRLQKEQGKVLTLEYDSVAAIARSTGLPFRDVYRSIELELSGKNEKGEETT